MDLSNAPTTIIRHDGWTPARKAQFLDALAGDGNVRAACARVGLSREAAYRLRRRDPLFARAWAAAHLLARKVVGEVLGSRAIDGIEEEVWHRGEVVGTRRRYDNRLLLAHIARLDKLAENEGAVEDADRFDELLACVAGEAIPAELALGPGLLPLDREGCAQMTAEMAEEDASDEDKNAAWHRGHAEGEALWDAWFVTACRAADRLLADPLTGESWPSTLSTVSTSSSPERGGEPPQVVEGPGQP
jgi:hypothetical protein